LIFSTIDIIVLLLINIYIKPLDFNYISNSIKPIDVNWKIILFTSLISLLLLFIAGRRVIKDFIYKVFNIPYINLMDRVIIAFILGTSFYQIIKKWIINNTHASNQSMDLVILYTLQSICLIFSIVRVFFIKNSLIEKKKTDTYLISDCPANIDLLNRSSFVENMYSSIKNLNINGSFVIGLYGRWGDGKTTILNFITDRIRKDKDLIVVNFNPWYFNSQDLIIKSFFSSLSNELRKNYLSLDLLGLLSNYQNLLSTSLEPFKLNKIVTAVFSSIDSKKTIDNLKSKIESRLQKLNKKVVILIDDIDRMDKNEILLVFKLIKLCSDFQNFIYILSMDKERIDNVLKDNLNEDNKYIDKIIQVGIEIPKVEREVVLDVLVYYVNELFEHYSIKLNSEYQSKLNHTFPYISKMFFDVRNIKRYINLLSLRFAQVGDTVNKYDFFIIETIEYLFPQKYKEIYLNRNKFVYYTDDFEVHLNSNKDKQRKDYFDAFFKDVDNSEILIKLLSSIFTSVKNYTFNYSNLISNYKADYENLKNRPIEDNNFFDLYFTFEKNKFTIINEKIENFINIINKSEEGEIYEYSKTIFNSLSEHRDQLSFFESFKGYIKYISYDKYKILIKMLYEFSYLFDDIGGSFSLSPYKRIEALTVDIIERSENTEQKKDLLFSVINDCNYLEFMRGVLHFSKTLTEQDNEFLLIREQGIQMLKNRLENEYLKPRKNIFNENQRYNGLWVFTNYIDDKKQIAEYYYDLLRENVKYTAKFLSVFKKVVTCSSAEKSWIVTSFDKESFEKYFDKNIVKRFVEKYEELKNESTGDEHQIINLFIDYFDGKITEEEW
jgi:Predicted P-loop ATPase